MSVLHLTSDNFEREVLKSDIPVMIDFWANWCMPCKMMSPIVDEIAKEMEGKVKVAKVNIDEEQALTLKYGITSIPTFVVIKNGNVVNQSIGMQDKQELLKLLGI